MSASRVAIFIRLGAVLLGLLSVAAGDATALEPPAQIAVSPSRFELALGDRPTTESVNLINMSDRDVTVQVSTANWDLDEANQIRLLEPDEQSLDQWMVINPVRFTVPAGETQTVRFSIRPRVRPEPGEHRAMIYFNQVLPEARDERILRVRFNVGVAVYAMVGDPLRAGRLNEVSVETGRSPVVTRFDVSSEGGAHVRLSGNYAVYPAALYPGVESTGGLDRELREGRLPEHVLVAGYLPARPVLPETRRDVFLRLARELPPGEYVLDLNGELAGERIDRAVPFSVPDPALVAGGDVEARPEEEAQVE
jgi:hypothetical protein